MSTTITYYSYAELQRKCFSCQYYEYKGNDWPVGKCTNVNAKIRNRDRYYNSPACVQKVPKIESEEKE